MCMDLYFVHFMCYGLDITEGEPTVLFSDTLVFGKCFNVILLDVLWQHVCSPSFAFLEQLMILPICFLKIVIID